MPFLRAGFNFRHRETGILGWTRPARGGRFAPALLIRFVPSGELAWLHNAERPLFLAWGENVVIGSWHGFSLPREWQEGLPRSSLRTREDLTGKWWGAE